MAFIEGVSSIHRNSKRSLVEFINLTFNVNLSPDELIVGVPVPVTGSYREGSTEKNTLVRVTAKEVSNYKGTIVVAYDRLDLSKLNNLLEFKVKAFEPQTTHDLLPVIWRRYGIILDQADIVDEPLVNHQIDEQLPPIYKLNVEPTALGWVGTCNLTVEEGDFIISEHVTSDTLVGLEYPANDDGVNGSAVVYMYGLDFTDYKPVLEVIPQGTILDDTYVDLLNAVKTVDNGTGQNQWNLAEASTTWALSGAEVIYNGPNDVALPTNQTYKYVIGIKLRDDVTEPPGTMYLHYNDQLDPSVVIQEDGEP